MWRTFLRLSDSDDLADAKTLARLSDGLTGADIQNISLSARRRAVLDGTDLNLTNILLAILSSHKGSPSLLDARKLTSDDKRNLAVTLHDRAEVSVTDIARLIGVSRQMAHRYLKGEEGEIDG